jgi:hypothetical protein
MRFLPSALAASLCVAGIATLAAQTPAPGSTARFTIELADYATVPMTGSTTGTGNGGSLARINVLRQEPAGLRRLWTNDLNGPLYIIDPRSKVFTPYLNFNGRDGKPGLFEKLPTAQGYANGLVTFQFDPDYGRNGIFYTVHIEEPAAPGSSMPRASAVPGLDLTGYTTTAPIKTPGDQLDREAVVIEWTDRNIENATFEGRAREILRVQLNTRIHPMGDLIFNPTARAGDADWRVMYIGCGDGGSGEQTALSMRMNPQRLDTMVGKILRIIPDLALHPSSSTVSDNGRYRVPSDNPFVKIAGARPEVWAYGLRNPHRLTWDVDPARPADSHLLAAVIGLHAWETVVVVRKGANYGYSEREGNQQLVAANTTGPLPSPDRVPVRIDGTKTEGEVTPTYPVLQYGHVPGGGDGIAGGFVYRGKKLPALAGKYIFADITTGRIWVADYKAMLAADDGKPETMAAFEEVQVRWTPPGVSAPGVYPTMFPVVLAAYKARGGVDPDLPGTSTVSGPGRADIRLAVDGTGELLILSKVDGMIRTVTGFAAR